MFNARLAKYIFLFLIVLSIVVPLFFINKMPTRIASHFNISNSPDSWMQKDNFLFFHFGLIFFFTLVFSGTAWLIRKLPYSLINLPNKEYWLHPSRKDYTYQVLESLIYYIGVLCVLLFILIFYMVYKANTDGSNRLSSYSWLLILAFVVSAGFITIKYIIHFNKKENQTGEE